ncbi:MAG: peptide deformylase [Dehalococcoidia bacterium]|nr:peptide deformylase [Dehalococcoidia bacterium]
MSVLEIKINPDPVLRKKAKKITSFDASVQRLIDDMIETMDKSSGVGLAANQIGVPLRVVVIRIPDQDVITLVNPEIIEKNGERLVIEGCLSVPGYQAEIKRAESVRIKAKDRHGKLFRKKGTGLLSQAFEHEIDHLNGILYIDYLQDTDKLVRTDSVL